MSWWTPARQRAAEERARKGGQARAENRRRARAALERRRAEEVERTLAPCRCEMPEHQNPWEYQRTLSAEKHGVLSRCRHCGLIIV